MSKKGKIGGGAIVIGKEHRMVPLTSGLSGAPRPAAPADPPTDPGLKTASLHLARPTAGDLPRESAQTFGARGDDALAALGLVSEPAVLPAAALGSAFAQSVVTARVADTSDLSAARPDASAVANARLAQERYLQKVTVDRVSAPLQTQILVQGMMMNGPTGGQTGLVLRRPGDRVVPEAGSAGAGTDAGKR